MYLYIFRAAPVRKCVPPCSSLAQWLSVLIGYYL